MGYVQTADARCLGELSGIWHGNDGGKYYIRQIGSQVWWFGFNTLSIGEGFSNVFYGTRNGSDGPTLGGQ